MTKEQEPKLDTGIVMDENYYIAIERARILEIIDNNIKDFNCDLCEDWFNELKKEIENDNIKR